MGPARAGPSPFINVVGQLLHVIGKLFRRNRFDGGLMLSGKHARWAEDKEIGKQGDKENKEPPPAAGGITTAGGMPTALRGHV
jgi:hypothetical protein